MSSNRSAVAPAPGIPSKATYHYDYADRHIINDAFNNTVLIQVLHDMYGALKMEEFQRIKAGLFWDYIPNHLLQSIRQAVDAGYKVVPAFVNGYNTGSGHIVYSWHPIESDNPLLFKLR